MVTPFTSLYRTNLEIPSEALTVAAAIFVGGRLLGTRFPGPTREGYH